MNTTEDKILFGFLLIVILLLILLYIYLPIRMARSRGRSVLGSLLLFWFTSPLFGIIILLILGDSEKKFRVDRYNYYYRDR